MTDKQSIAYQDAMTACALIEAQGMTAQNMQRQQLGQSMAYVYVDFYNLIDKYGIHHNAIITNLTGG